LLINRLSINILRILFFIFLFSVILILQISYFKRILIFGVKPELFLIGVYLISLYKGKYTGVISGFLLGLVEDCFSGSVLGSNALSKTIISYLTNIASHYLQLEKLSLQSIIFFLLYYLNSFIIVFINLIFDRLKLNETLLRDIFWGSLYNLILAFLILGGLKILKNE
jgi:rod shape-determining protein MreD